jgi:hypothetical protein
MNSYKNVSFIKLFFRFGIVFFILIFCIETVFSIVKNASFSIMLSKHFYNSQWQNYIGKFLLFSVLYGLFMAGYYKIFKK